jgi:hypothetical protein
MQTILILRFKYENLIFKWKNREIDVYKKHQHYPDKTSFKISIILEVFRGILEAVIVFINTRKTHLTI